MNEIQWTNKARKQLSKLDAKTSQTLYQAAQVLAHMPNVQNVKALVNHRYAYRLRVGNYRVLFNWEGAIKVVEIEEVKKRDDRTY